MCLKNVNRDVEGKTANSGVEAIEMLKKDAEYTPDYIFLDVNMPKMNGVECLKHLRKIERLNSTKILMYSTTSEKDVVTESKSSGADDFIMKPVKTKELKTKLATIFNIVSEINQPD
jgi:CheY-like chemotaxis protein